jgi:hypothetical protein
VASPTPRFFDNDDGTVTDNLTGLIWLKNANCFNSISWKTALDTANALANGECGLTDGSVPGDWRLPNVRELRSLIDHGSFGPALPANYPFISVQSSNYYWSSTSLTGSPGNAWGIYSFVGDHGDIGTFGKVNLDIPVYMWPVRDGQQVVPPAPLPQTGQTLCYDQNGVQINCSGSGQDGDKQAGVLPLVPRFNDSGDGAVTDNLTGLIWLKDADCSDISPTTTWQTALSNVNNLADGQCGLTDGSMPGQWRLPNIRELESLFDYGRFNPALPDNHPFINVQSSQSGPTTPNGYWSSTSRVNIADRAYFGNFYDGLLYSNLKGLAPLSYSVWPVRGGQ